MTNSSNSLIRRTAAVFTFVVVTCAAVPASAQIVLAESESGWKASMMGLISIWGEQASWDEGFDEDTFRVTTGYNPSKIEFIVNAPEHNGINVSTYFQLAASLQTNKARRAGEQIEVRGAAITISSGVGTFQFGRHFGIYGSSATVNDTGSMRGTGYICVGPDGSGPNCGHIGTGYTWADWTMSLQYHTPQFGGFQLRVGLMDPLERAFGVPGGGTPFIATADLAGDFNGTFFNFTDIQGTGSLETDTPLIEAELTFNHAFGENGGNSIAFWADFMTQNVEDLGPGSGDADITGVGIGGRLKLGALGISGNYEDNEGIAEGFMAAGVRCDATGCDAVEGDQWYANVDFTVGNVVLGASYGEGTEDASAVVGNSDVERELIMGYVQWNITPNLNLNVEVQSFERTTANNGAAAFIFASQEEYTAFLLGAEFRW